MRQRLLGDEEPTVFLLALVLTMVLSATPAVITLAAILLAAPVAAEPTSWGRTGKENAAQTGRSDDDRRVDRKEHGRQFSDHDRFVVREYYQANFPISKCALGPGEKNSGCLPQGQAKKWQIGHQLPTGLVYSEVPPPIISQLPPPSAGLRYVRIGNDILLISVRTEVVVDAIQDLGRMEAQTSRE